MTQFTIKKLHGDMKHGLTVAQVMEKYGFESEEKLFEAIRRNASSKAEQFIKVLRKNEKLPKHREAVETISDVNSEPTPNIAVVPEVTLEVTDNNVMAMDDTSEVVVTVPVVSKLAQLEADRQAFSDELYAKEVSHKRKMQERKQIADRLRSCKNILAKLLHQVDEVAEEVTLLGEQYSLKACEMRALDLEMSECRMVLADIDEMIEELKQVVFLVRSSNIEVENAELPATNPDEVSALFSELLTKDDAEELTVREIKTVAQLILVTRSFKHYEVVFENPKMETLFGLFKPTE